MCPPDISVDVDCLTVCYASCICCDSLERCAMIIDLRQVINPLNSFRLASQISSTPLLDVDRNS